MERNRLSLDAGRGTPGSATLPGASHKPSLVVVVADKSRAPLISSAQLFGTRRTVLIEHEGQCYTLRLTRENKLILTK